MYCTKMHSCFFLIQAQGFLCISVCFLGYPWDCRWIPQPQICFLHGPSHGCSLSHVSTSGRGFFTHGLIFSSPRRGSIHWHGSTTRGFGPCVKASEPAITLTPVIELSAAVLWSTTLTRWMIESPASFLKRNLQPVGLWSQPFCLMLADMRKPSVFFQATLFLSQTSPPPPPPPNLSRGVCVCVGGG